MVGRQNKEYAHHVVASWNEIQPASPQVIARRLEVRMRRQELLTKPHPLRISALLDEAVLLRCVGGREVMYRQLEHLAELIRLPNIELRLLPLDAPRQPIMGESFILLRFSSSYDVKFPDVAHVESVLAIHTQDDSLTHIYTLVWEKQQESALSPEESLERIAQIAHDHWR